METRRDRLESNNENGKMFSGFDQRNAMVSEVDKGERAEVEKVEEEEQMNRLNGQTKLQEERQQLK